MHYASTFDCILKHFKNYLVVNGHLSLLHIISQLLNSHSIIEVNIHSDEKIFHYFQWNFERSISLIEIFGWTLKVLGNISHAHCFVRILCTFCSKLYR